MSDIRITSVAILFLAGTASAATKPNVLFLFTDDQRADGLAALGNRAVHTPSLDRLVKSGFTFTNAYCLGSGIPAVCTPSRNMLLCGSRVLPLEGAVGAGGRAEFPVAMKAAGYETYHHGKQGNTAPDIQKHFDHNLYVNENKERTSGQPGKTIVDAAIRFLHKRKVDRPFFMYLAFEASTRSARCGEGVSGSLFGLRSCRCRRTTSRNIPSTTAR